MRLESLQHERNIDSEPGSQSGLEERIAELRERLDDLEKRITARSEKSVELTTRQRELDQLQRIADEMSLKLEKLDIEASAPERIRQIQQAVVNRE
jgi:predicted  nucleic acid-binding Zn-ribbon protein